MALRKAKSGSSGGQDVVTNDLLRAAGSKFKSQLLTIYRASWRSGILPKAWKMGVVIPIPKLAQPRTCKDYRPITLLSVLGKVMEAIIKARLQDYLERKKKLARSQYGFRSKSSCEAAIADLIATVDSWASAKRPADTLFVSFDVQKAFDTVWLEGLLHKMRHRFGLSGNILRWVADYLRDRWACVRGDGVTSNWHKMDSGVPQGGVLSPLLFIMFIDDLGGKISTDTTRVSLFADDTAIMCPYPRREEDRKEALRKAQEAVGATKRWFELNLLSFNAQKTKLVLITPPRTAGYSDGEDPRDSISLKLGSATLTPQTSSETSRFLGVFLDNHLALKQHVKMAAEKAELRVSVLRYLGGATWGCREKTLTNIYRTWIRPLMEYCPLALIRVTKDALHPLEIAQNKAIRAIGRATASCAVAIMEVDLAVEPLQLRRARLAAYSCHRVLTAPDASNSPFGRLWEQAKNPASPITFPAHRGKKTFGSRKLVPILRSIFTEFSLPKSASKYEDTRRFQSLQPHECPKDPLSHRLRPNMTWPLLGSASDRPDSQRAMAQAYARRQSSTAKGRTPYVYYTDGSAIPPDEGGGAAAAVIVPGGSVLTNNLGPIAGNNEAEVVAIRLALEHAVRNRPVGKAPVVVLSDNQVAITQINSSLTVLRDRWTEVRRAQEAMRKLEEAGHKVYVDWVPGHARDPGNEAADKEAKEALKSTLSTDRVKIAKSALQYHVRNRTAEIWQQWWVHETKKATAGGRIKWFEALCPTIKHRLDTGLLEDPNQTSVPRKMQTVIRRLRWRDTICNRDLTRWRKRDTGTVCTHCEAEDTPEHRFLECVHFGQARASYLDELQDLNPSYNEMTPLRAPGLPAGDRRPVLEVLMKFLAHSSLADELLEVPDLPRPDEQSNGQDDPERRVRPRRGPPVTLQDYFARAASKRIIPPPMSTHGE